MPIHVKVLQGDQYKVWVEEETKKAAAKRDDPNKVWKMEELMARGEKVYAANCAVCHQPNGKGAGPIKPLDGSAIVQGPLAEAMHVVLEGRNNGAMPSWKALSDVELAAVLTFAKNHWSNKTGQMIQPAQFKDARAGKFPEGGSPAPAAGAAPAEAPAPAAAPQADVAPASTGLPLQVLFVTGESALNADAQAVLAQAVDYLKAHADIKVALSGFVDATGNAQQNAELAKQRAQAVAKALTDAGVAQDRIDLRKPQTITAAAGADQQARRVDIVAAQ